MAQREIQHVVEHAIDELPEAFRIVFIARVIEGMNVEETAEILGLKPETVKTRLHRARAMLRDNVEKKIGPVVMDAFPFAGKRCERLTEAVLKRLGYSPYNFFGNLCASLRHPIPVQPTNAPARQRPAPQECQIMFVRLSAAIAALSLLEQRRAGARRKADRSADRAYRLYRRRDRHRRGQAGDVEIQEQGRQGVRRRHGARP